MTGLALLPEISHSNVTPSISIGLKESDLGCFPLFDSIHVTSSGLIALQSGSSQIVQIKKPFRILQENENWNNDVLLI